MLLSGADSYIMQSLVYKFFFLRKFYENALFMLVQKFLRE